MQAADVPEERKWSFDSINYGWAIWWSKYIWDCQSAAGSSRQQQHLLHNPFHNLFHLHSGSSTVWLENHPQ
jgi:hypothetical protein